MSGESAAGEGGRGGGAGGVGVGGWRGAAEVVIVVAVAGLLPVAVGAGRPLARDAGVDGEGLRAAVMGLVVAQLGYREHGGAVVVDEASGGVGQAHGGDGVAIAITGGGAGASAVEEGVGHRHEAQGKRGSGGGL